MTYTVQQGVFSNTGVGDYTLYKEFDNLDAATAYFNKIKNAKRGYTIYKHQHLETILTIAGDLIPIAWWNKD